MDETKLNQLRLQVDAIDVELLRLLNERAVASLAIGKAKGDSPVYDPVREGKVLQRIADQNEGPLSKGSIEEVFTCVITACRELQQQERLSQ